MKEKTKEKQEESEIENNLTNPIKYQKLLSDPTTKAIILPSTLENIEECASYILSNGIVGMPTETVYGLAANAYSLEACLKIFEYKGRPLTDPLIVHVSSIEMALSLTHLSQSEESLFYLLTKNFWPGPLTIVLKANLDKLSTKILAGNDCVGIRFPTHKVAQELISISGVPIAAPSANKFCHISPVNPLHVFEDFREFPVKILNGGVTNFCMESTVMKFNIENKEIIIFRMGAVSPDDIKKVISNSQFKDFKIECLAGKNKISQEEIKRKEKEIENDSFTISQDAPGQFLKHYSPKVETFLYSGNKGGFVKEIELNDNIIFIDYKENLKMCFCGKNGVTDKNFIELSVSGDPMETMKNFYDSLHNAEEIKNIKTIVICDLEMYMEENSHKLTLLDRMWKAASFKKVKINL